MKRQLLMAAGLLLAGCTGAALAQQAEGEAPRTGPPPMPQPATMAQRPQAIGGEALYVQYCAMCHGPGGMGTGLLGRTRPVALLEARDNLPAAYVVLAARQGVGNMPAIPRGEVSGADLQAIADYLAAGPHDVAQGAAQ